MSFSLKFKCREGDKKLPKANIRLHRQTYHYITVVRCGYLLKSSLLISTTLVNPFIDFLRVLGSMFNTQNSSIRTRNRPLLFHHCPELKIQNWNVVLVQSRFTSNPRPFDNNASNVLVSISIISNPGAPKLNLILVLFHVPFMPRCEAGETQIFPFVITLYYGVWYGTNTLSNLPVTGLNGYVNNKSLQHQHCLNGPAACCVIMSKPSCPTRTHNILISLTFERSMPAATTVG